MRLVRLTFLLLALPLAAHAAKPVTTASLDQLLVAVEHSAPATLLPLNQPGLTAQISARIDAIPVRVGDSVDEGQTLVALDCRAREARLDASRARLSQLQAQTRFSRAQLVRARDLKRRSSISDEELERRQSELDDLKAQVLGQQAKLTQDRIEIDHCTVRAPFAALVSERLLSVGDLASPGTPLLRLVQLDDLELSARLRDDEAARLMPGARYWFDYQGKRVPVQLRRVLPLVDTTTRTREARFSVDGVDGLPAGAAGRLVWQAPTPAVPAEYQVRRGQRLGLFLLVDGKARFHPLNGAVEGQPASVTLPPDTVIIVQGRHALADGDAVTPMPANG